MWRCNEIRVWKATRGSSAGRRSTLQCVEYLQSILEFYLVEKGGGVLMKARRHVLGLGAVYARARETVAPLVATGGASAHCEKQPP